jgi:hypothetical protein
MEMTRSRSQVLYQYLPEAVFLHESGFIGRVWNVRTQSTRVNKALLLETLASQLDRWDNKAGFPDPRRARDKYDIAEPVDEVLVDLWPLTLECSRPSCRKLKVYHRIDDFLVAPSPERCDRPGCGGRRRQLEFLMVHHCGELKQLNIRPCPRHQYDWLVLDDTGSFGTAELRCRAGDCNGTPVSRLGFRMCDCQMPTGDRYMRSLTVRAPNRHQVQHFAFVSMESGPIDKLRRQPGGDKVVTGSYLGYFPDVLAGLDEARKQVKGDPAQWAVIEAALRAQGIPEDIISAQRAANLGEAQGVFTEMAQHISDDVVGRIGRQQKCCERALIFNGPPADSGDGLVVESLADYRNRADQLGHSTAVDRLDKAQQALHEHGFERLLVVTNFPIALVAYGYTRLTSDEHVAMLRSFRPTQKGSAQKPIYVGSSNTEAIFFELDCLRVRNWLVANGFVDDPARWSAMGDDRVAVKAALLVEADAETDAHRMVQRLCHTLAHTLIRNLGERAGFGEDTMAEYLIPEMLTIGLYANVHQDFTLGALVSLVEHNLRSWLEASRQNAETCTWDPVCGEAEGACANCLHLAFGCEHWNRDLDRAVLFGTASEHHEGDRVPVRAGFWEF